MTSALEPVRPNERFAVVDILRGVALLGILLVNFSGTVGKVMPEVDRVTGTVLDLLISDSFYPLFSFLFGLGLALHLVRARGTGIAHIYLRRMLVLFLIGTVHALLIWDGDVLAQYAVLGLVLIPLQRLPSRGLLAVVLFLLVFQFVGARVQGALASVVRTTAVQRERELKAAVRQENFGVSGNLGIRAEEDGSWSDNLAYRWDRYAGEIRDLSRPLRILGQDILLFFVIGLFAGRRRWLEDIRPRTRAFAWVALGGAILALAGNLLRTAFPDVGGDAETALIMAANWGVTACCIAGVALLVARGRLGARILAPLGPVGRLGLSNYLLQSLVMTALFFPYGLNLPDWGATAVLAISLAIFLGVQVPLSHWWLARFHFGPAEWLWRSLTYGYAQPMRREDPVRKPIPLPVSG